MPGLTIGSVSVSVVPNAVNFSSKLSAKLLPEADALGKEIGSRISAGVESALRDIGIKLDTSEVDAQIDEVGAKLDEAGRDRTVSLGLDDTRIVAALDGISAKLDHLSAGVYDVELELNAGRAVTQLDEIALKLDEIGSRDATPKLGLDDSSFNRQLDEDMAKLSAAGSASASPGLGSGALITGGILGGLTAAPALPGVLAGGGAAIGTLGLAMQGIGPALSAYTAAQTAAGTATGKTGAAAAGAAAAIGAAQGAVSKAETQAAHDAITSSESIKNAQAAVAQATQQAASAQISAEEQLANAQYAEKQAQQALTDARQQAILTLQQLHNAEADTALSAEQATLDLEQAKINEAATDKSATATALQKEQADLSVREAQQRLKEALEAKTNASNASNKADKEGVNGLPAVVAAQHNLAQAHQSVGDAQRNLVNAEQQGAAAIAKAQQSLADAVRNASWQQQSDAQAVSDAQGRLQTAYGSATGGASSASDAAAKYAQALAQLSPAGQEMVKEIIGLKDGLHALEGTAQTAIAPGFTVFLEGVHALLPLISQEVGAMGKILGDGLAAAGRAFQSSGFQATLKTLFDEGNQFFRVVGPAVGDFLRMFADAGAKSGPAVAGFAAGIASIVRGLGQMVLALAPAAPAIGQLLAALGKIIGGLGPALGIALGEIAKAAAPVAVALAAVIAAIPPDVLGDIIAAILGVVVAVKLWSVGQAILNAVMLADPIVLVAVAIAAVGVAFYEAWKHSAAFRTVIKDIGIAFIDAGIVIVQANKMIIDIVLDMFSSVVHAAATAFGWVPGVGSKLKGAAKAFDGFKLDVDNSIDGVTNTMRGWRDSLTNSVSTTHDLMTKASKDFDTQAKAARSAKTDLQNYSTAIHDNGVNSDVANAARDKLIRDLISAGVNADTAKTDVGNYTTAVKQNGLNSDQAQAARKRLIGDILTASGNAKTGKTDLKDYTTAVQDNGLKSDAAQSARAKLIKDLENSGVNAKTATTLVDNLGTAVKNLPASKRVDINMYGKGQFSIKELFSGGSGKAGIPGGPGATGGGGGGGVPAAARGMYVATGTPGVDDQLILAQRGELVVPPKIVASGAVDHLRGKIPGFLQGGVVGGADAAAPPATSGNLNGAYVTGMYKTFQSDMTNSMVTVMRTALKAAEAAASGGPIVAFAKSFLGKIPYVWGGTSLGPAGSDCSGFTQSVLGHYGIAAPRTSEAQGAWVKKGPPIPGGLAFYHSPGGGADPGHVAIVANAGSVVSQGGGMGPQMRALKYMPLLWTGIPPGGFHGAGGPGGGSGGNGAADGSVISPTAAAAQTWMKAHMANYGWGAGQWPALQQLWSHESGWRWNAQNPSSPAYGIPQADPGSKMAADGADWRTNSVTQMKWGAEYIKDKYTTPSNAWYLWQARSPHWYDEGGWLPPGLTLTHNNTGRPEPILTGQQWDMISSAVTGGDGVGLGGRAMAKRLDRMIHLLEQAPGRTAAGVGDSINGSARSAVTRAYFRTR